MQAEVTKQGDLRLIPESETEEVMANLWYDDMKKEGTKVSSCVLLEAAPLRPWMTAGDVKKAEAKKTEKKPPDPPEPEQKPPAKKFSSKEKKAMKEELDKLGIEYDKRSSAKKLYELLEQSRNNIQEPPAEEPPAEDPPAEDPPAEPEEKSIITKEDIREKLKQTSAVCGQATARKLLTDYDAVKISEVPEEEYEKFMAQMDAAIKAKREEENAE